MSVEGSVDAPPIILTRRRDLALLQAGLSLVVLAGGVWLCWDGWHGPLDDAAFKARIYGVLGVVFGAPVSLMGLLYLLRPPTLKLSPEGLRYDGAFGVQSWRWSDITRMWLVGSRNRFVALSYGPDRPRSLMDRVNGMLGGDGALTGGWPIPPESLLELLQSAHAKWYRRGSAVRAPGAPGLDLLDHGRVEINQTRFLPALMLATILIITGCMGQVNGWDWESYAVIAFCLVVSWPYTHAVFWPDQLLIEPQGITIVRYGRRRELGWAYGNFRVQNISHGRRRICFDAVEPGAGRAAYAWFSRWSGFSALPGGWEMAPEMVADLLNAARKKWAGPVANRPIVH